MVFYLLHSSCGFYAQERCDLKGEVVFPWINQYSGYGMNDTLAQKLISAYESTYNRSSSRKKKENYELSLFALLRERKLLFNPYVIIKNTEGEELILYMDTLDYQKTLVWNYNFEELTTNQNYLFLTAKGIWLGENAYWLTDLYQLTLLEDKIRTRSTSKFAMDVYRK